MKLLRKIVALVLVLGTLTCVLPSATVIAEGAEAKYSIVPELGDGASIAPEELQELYVVGSLSDDRTTFTYTRSRTLSFTVNLEDGWTYNANYSTVFTGDESHLTLTADGKGIYVTYRAEAGQKIAFESLRNVGFYTTPRELPKMYLTIDMNWDNVDKETWVDAQMEIVLGTKAFESGNFVGACQVKGRGNMSWGKDQKPYSINFEKKTSLLDFPKIKKYCIVSNACDASMLHNLITYQTYQDLDGITYTVHSEPVLVYLNGDEAGVYILSERLRISGGQIDDVQAAADNVSGAYLIEKTVTGKKDANDVCITAPYHGHADAEDLLLFKDPDEPTDDMKQYVHDAFFSAHDAIMSSSPTAYQSYIDTASWVDFIIVQEVAKNVDGELKTSCFMYMPSGSTTLHFTSPWDFDLAYGSSNGNNNGEWKYPDGSSLTVTDSPSADTPEGFMTICGNCPWFVSLYGKADFNRALKEKYTEYRYTLLEDLQNNVNRYAAYLDGYGSKSKTTSLKSWLKERLEWLDSQWLLDDYKGYDCKMEFEILGECAVTATDGVADFAGVGAQKTYTFTPAEGFSLVQVTFNGEDVTDQVTNGRFTTPYLSDDCAFTLVLASGSLSFSGLINGHGETMEGFTVTLSQDGEVVHRTLSTGSTYTFTDVSTGTYILTISKDGYVSDVNTVTLYKNDDSKTNILFRLGDCDLDGYVTSGDLSLLAGYLCRAADIPKKKAVGAVTFSGGSRPHASDLTLLAKYVGGVIDKLK